MANITPINQCIAVLQNNCSAPGLTFDVAAAEALCQKWRGNIPETDYYTVLTKIRNILIWNLAANKGKLCAKVVKPIPVVMPRGIEVLVLAVALLLSLSDGPFPFGEAAAVGLVGMMGVEL